MKHFVTLFVLTLSAVIVNAADKPLELRGKIDSVTVYRGQALVARVIEVPAPGGLKEIVITDLPPRVVASSVFAESLDGAEVRSVLFRERAVDKDVREEARKLDDALRGVQDEIVANQRGLQTLAEQREYLNKLEGFVAPTAQLELTKGVLNAETIKTLTAFQFDQRALVAVNELKLKKEGRELTDKLQILQRQRAELTGGSNRSVREAVIFAQIPEAGGKMRLRYLVDSATWFPSYNLRAEHDAKQVRLEFNASIQQLSGEDWTDVQMTLSTATPSMVAMAPALDPLSVSLQAAVSGKPDASAAGYYELKSQLEETKKTLNYQRGTKGNSFNRDNAPMQQQAQQSMQPNGEQNQAAGDEVDGLDRAINGTARDLQVLEIMSKDVQKKSDSKRTGDETVSVTYQLANRTSLPSRQDMQLIQVASSQVKAEFFKLAAPVLTTYVYDQATLTNDGKMVLLAGPSASYLGGQFVGGGQIPTVAVGETFTVGFGIDSALRARREMRTKTETTQGGNKVLNFEYQLIVENFGSTPATVRLTDRLPTSKENEVTSQLIESSLELSKDPTYLKQDRKNNLLRWDLPVPAQAIGPQAATLDYKFQLQFDRQMSIVGMPTLRK